MSPSKPLQPLQIEVCLDPEAEQPVTVSPVVFPVEEKALEIIWMISSKSPVRDFHFFDESLHFHKDPGCFSRERPRANRLEFSVHDDNTCKGQFGYTLKVLYQGKHYSTKSKKNPGGDDGEPVIHNK